MGSEIVARTVVGDLDLFGHAGQAKMYQEYRPVYPKALIDYVVNLVPEYKRNLYVDVACGSGQLTSGIAPHFHSSIGIDKSLEQLGQAKDAKIEWRSGSAFDLSLKDSSVDLLTVAQGLHWLVPYDKFFAEIDRVLPPGGVFAAVAYAFPKLLHCGANEIVEHFYVNILGGRKSPGDEGCLWETNRPTIDGFYADIPFPQNTQTRHFKEQVTLSIRHYTNYLRTLSAYRTLLRVSEPGLVDPIDDIEKKLTLIFSNATVEVEIDFFVVSYSRTNHSLVYA